MLQRQPSFYDIFVTHKSVNFTTLPLINFFYPRNLTNHFHRTFFLVPPRAFIFERHRHTRVFVTCLSQPQLIFKWEMILFMGPSYFFLCRRTFPLPRPPQIHCPTFPYFVFLRQCLYKFQDKFTLFKITTKGFLLVHNCTNYRHWEKGCKSVANFSRTMTHS